MRTIEEIVTSTTTSGQTGPMNNDNKGVLHTSQSSRSGASPPDAV